jgi:hypothetical protein
LWFGLRSDAEGAEEVPCSRRAPRLLAQVAGHFIGSVVGMDHQLPLWVCCRCGNPEPGTVSDRVCDPCLALILAGCTSGTEYFLEHPDHPGYSASNLGRIRGPHGKILVPFIVKGYLKVKMPGRHRRVHHLVLETYIGPKVDGELGLHWDDDPTNNTLMNLRWADEDANVADRRRNRRRRGPACAIEGCDNPARYRDPEATCAVHYAIWRRGIAHRAMELAAQIA